VTVVLNADGTESVTGDTTSAASDAPDASTAGLASWGARAGAFGVDVLIGLGVVAALVSVAWAIPEDNWRRWVLVVAAALVLLAVAVNRLLLPATIGWSLGRAMFGISVAGRGGDTVGPWRLLARDGAHLLDTVPLLLGWLWPLLDARRRTFADLLARTEVHVVGARPPAAKGLAAAVLAAAAVVAVAAAGLGYVTVYRHDLQIAQAREQLAVQGPKLVTDMLSYEAKTMQADFERSRTLVTDAYRPQLEAQQKVLQGSPVVDNEYWATNSAVLNATSDRGTMLVLLQGQRGVDKNMRTITATVRVEFEKFDGQWKLANLTVLAKPRPGGGR